MKIMPWVGFTLALLIAYSADAAGTQTGVSGSARSPCRVTGMSIREPLPRWGGLAMVGAFLLTLAIVYAYLATHRHIFPWTPHQLQQFAGVLVAGVLVAAVGTLDDKYEMSALWQSLALIGAGVVLVCFGVRIEGITNPFAHGSAQAHPRVYDPATWLPFPFWFSAAATVVWGVRCCQDRGLPGWPGRAGRRRLCDLRHHAGADVCTGRPIRSPP